MARLRLDQVLDGGALGVGFGVVQEMQHDAGAAAAAHPAASTGDTANAPLPSEDHSQAASLPARREMTSTRSATMKAE